MNNSAKIKLVVADVDGTLVTHDKRLTPAVIDAAKRVRKAGIKFTITSSRPPRGLTMIVDALRLSEPIPAFNGALLVGPDLRTVLREKFLEPVVVEQVIRALEQAGVDIWVFTDTEWLVTNPQGVYVEHEVFTVRFEPRVVAKFEPPLLQRVAKLVGVSKDFDLLARVEKELQQTFGDSVAATRSQKYYLDVTHPMANKGEGILLLAELLDIPANAIATVGDMENDVPMFRQSGLSIAMGNASPEVQKMATFITDSNEEDGFAKAMNRYILPRVASVRS